MAPALAPPLPESIKALRIDSIEAGASEVDKTYPTGGFKSLGHFLFTVARAGHARDPNAVLALGRWDGIARKAAAGMGIRLDDLADFFVPVEFSESIYARMLESEYDLFARVRRLTVRGNRLKLYAEDDADRDEDSSRLAGVTTSWVEEGDPIPESEFNGLRSLTFDLHKLAALVYLSNELWEDSEGKFDQQAQIRATRAMTWEIGRQIFEGIGGGVPLGAFIAGNGSLITVDPGNGQVAGSLTRPNLRAMVSRMMAGDLRRAVWHLNTEALESLWAMNDDGGAPVFSPATDPGAYANLLHRPVVPLEYCEALGTPNDIVLAAWDAYQVVFKGQTRRDISMHVNWSKDESAIRFVFRMDGKPLWNKPMTPYQGTRESSPFLRLGARA